MQAEKSPRYHVHGIAARLSVSSGCVQVPKCLGMIGEEWAPHCFRVSFKLETDHERLLPKARVALEK